MSIELEQKLNNSSILATVGGATLIATPIGAATAGDLLASGSLGSLGSEAAEQDHRPDTGIRPADLQQHGLDGGSSPTPAVLDHAATGDAAPALEHPAVAAPVHEALPSAAGTAVPAVSTSDHGIQTASAAESHPAADAGSHANPEAQAIAHQFDLLIAAGNAAGPTEGLVAATPHQANVGDGGMIGGVDPGGLDLGDAKHV